LVVGNVEAYQSVRQSRPVLHVRLCPPIHAKIKFLDGRIHIARSRLHFAVFELSMGTAMLLESTNNVG